ncbi:MAG: hypothetical protein P8018_01255 [Acidobacteriota bacterium]
MGRSHVRILLSALLLGALWPACLRASGPSSKPVFGTSTTYGENQETTLNYGKQKLLSIKFKDFKVDESKETFTVRQEIPSEFKVEAAAGGPGLDFAGNPVPHVTCGFYPLDDSAPASYFWMVESFELRGKDPDVVFKISLWLPKGTFSQYALKKIQSRRFLLERTGKINPKLSPVLGYSLGFGGSFVLHAAPDEALIDMSAWRNNQLLADATIRMVLPWGEPKGGPIPEQIENHQKPSKAGEKKER